MTHLNKSKEQIEDEILSVDILILDMKDCYKKCIKNNNKDDYMELSTRIHHQERVKFELVLRLSL